MPVTSFFISDMMKRIFLTIASLVCISVVGFAQSKDAMILADSLKALAGYPNNGWGVTPKEWTWQEQLKSVASNDDLVKLATSHPNAAARAFAFQALVGRKDNRYHKILFNSIHDTTQFTSKNFDVWSIDNVANYMVSVLVDHTGYMSIEDSLLTDSLFRSDPRMMEYAQHLYETFINTPTIRDFRQIFTKQDSITLDSILFYTPNLSHIYYLQRILQRLPADRRYYNRLREMYYDEHYDKALIALCRHHRDDDKPAVIECLLEYSNGLDKRHVFTGEPKGRTNEGLEAVAIWPDKDFIPTLKEVRDFEVSRTHYDYKRIRLFYLALMAYDDEQSYQMIDETLKMTEKNKTTQKYHLEQFGKALEENPNPKYQPLLTKYSDIK